MVKDLVLFVNAIVSIIEHGSRTVMKFPPSTLYLERKARLPENERDILTSLLPCYKYLDILRKPLRQSRIRVQSSDLKFSSKRHSRVSDLNKLFH